MSWQDLFGGIQTAQYRCRHSEAAERTQPKGQKIEHALKMASKAANSTRRIVSAIRNRKRDDGRVCRHRDDHVEVSSKRRTMVTVAQAASAKPSAARRETGKTINVTCCRRPPAVHRFPGKEIDTARMPASHRLAPRNWLTDPERAWSHVASDGEPDSGTCYSNGHLPAQVSDFGA